MRLFNCIEYKEINGSESDAIVTPLGIIHLDVFFNEKMMTEKSSDKVFSTAKGGKVFCWYSEFADIELLVCKPDVRIPSDMTLIDCIAGVWRVRANQTIKGCNFLAKWGECYTWLKGGPNSGEHLDAQIWEDGNVSVAIGTEDGERLSIRATQNDYMPHRLKGYLDNLGLVQCSSDSLLVPVSNLNVDEICQIHFVIAWAKDDIATWYAVDMRGNDILRDMGCV